jgi:hypothetical protein
MDTFIFRVLVRGELTAITDDDRPRLLNIAGREPHQAAFTELGTLTFDDRLVTFGFRVQLRERSERADDAAAVVIERASALAAERLAELGVTYRNLRVDASDMAQVWS